MSIDEVFKLADNLVTVAGAVIRAITDGRPERVEMIVGAELKTTIAKAAADARAIAKFPEE